MLNFFKQHYQFLLMLAVWVIAGAINEFIALAVIPLSLLLLKQKDRYVEMLIGFLFILIISDSRNPVFAFAGLAKSAYLIVLAALFFLNSKKFTTPNQFFLPFVPFFIVALLSLTKSPITMLATQKTVSYILLYLTIPAYINKCLTDHKELFIKYLIYFITGILLFGFLLAIITPRYSMLFSRFMGIFGNPNGVGLFCLIIFSMVTVVFDKYGDYFSRQEKRFVYGVIIASVLFAISRNSIFSILIFLFFQRFYNISSWLGFIIVILTAILYQVVALNLVSIIETLGLQEYFRTDTLETGSGRFVAWNFAWNYIQENFILGSGFAFDEYYFDLHQEGLQKLGHQGGVHNMYLAVWLNTGVIGLICFLYAFFKTVAKASIHSKLTLPIMFSFLFSLTFEGWLMGSLHPYNIGFILTFVILMHQSTNEPKAEHTLS